MTSVKKLVENKPVLIFDELLEHDEVTKFYDFVVKLSFTKTERDGDFDEYPIFSVDFMAARFEKEVTVAQTGRELLNAHFPGKEYLLTRAYINLSNYGDMEFPHRDCSMDRHDITVLYYVNPVWKHFWGGETLFYENHQTRVAILPTPGRFVLFDGSIEHTGTVPNRICKSSRLTLAMKYAEINSNHE